MEVQWFNFRPLPLKPSASDKYCIRFSKGNKILIDNPKTEKEQSTREMLKENAAKQWSRDANSTTFQIIVMIFKKQSFYTGKRKR